MTEKLSVNYELLEIFQFQEAQLDKKLSGCIYMYIPNLKLNTYTCSRDKPELQWEVGKGKHNKPQPFHGGA